MLCAKDALASCLKPKWYGPGRDGLHICHLGMKARAVVDPNQGCSSVNCPVVTLVGWLVLV